MPRINLLPWREQLRRERKLAFFVSLGIAAGVAAVTAFAAYLLLGSMIDSQDRRNARLQAEIKLLDKQIEEINDLEAQKQRSCRSLRSCSARDRKWCTCSTNWLKPCRMEPI